MAESNNHHKVSHCRICGWYGRLTTHHVLWERKKWRNHPEWKRMTILLCGSCHRMVHDRYPETRFGTGHSS